MSVADHVVSLVGDRATRLTERQNEDSQTNTVSRTEAFEHTSKPDRNTKRYSDFRQWRGFHARRLMAFDALAGGITIGLATLAPTALHPMSPAGWLALFVIGVLAWPLWVGLACGYRRDHLAIGGHQTMAVLRALVVGVVLTALPAAWFGIHRPLSTVAIGAPLAAAISILGRTGWRRHLRRSQHSGEARQRMIIVGSVEPVRALARMITDHEPGVELVGVCVPSTELPQAEADGLPVVGDLEHVATTAAERDCHAVAAVGTDSSQPNFLRQLAWSLEGLKVDLLVYPGLVDVARPRMHIAPYQRFSLLHVDLPQFSGWRRRLKRALDVALVAAGLLVIWPLLLLTAIMIKIEDRGPVIFRQTRIGVDGRPFTMYKFRSMVIDAERQLAALAARNEGAGPLFKMHRDPRVTRVGAFIRKYSIDELPQLVNVLTGSMSLVGPRPPLQNEVAEYATDTRRRLKVMPGLTGLWQVSGRSGLSWEESVRLDLWYVENWSIGQDLKIISKTARAVLAKNGAY